MHETGNEARRQVRPRGIVLNLPGSAHQPALIDVLRKLRLEYVELPGEDLEMGVYVAVAEDRLDVLRIVSMILRSQGLILHVVRDTRVVVKCFDTVR